MLIHNTPLVQLVISYNNNIPRNEILQTIELINLQSITKRDLMYLNYKEYNN